jgi:hypothetical protein
MSKNAKRMRDWRKKKKETDPKWWEGQLAKKREEYARKRAEDPEYYNKKMTEWRKKKMKKDPDWNARRQREFRKKHPDKYNFIMAKSYMRKLPPEKRAELIKGLENGR